MRSTNTSARILVASGITAVVLLFQAGAQTEPSPVTIGEAGSISSQILGESRRLFVSKPAAYEEEPAARYPVLYLLDGETHFTHASSIVRFLAASDRIPEMLVIGVASESMAKRTRDLTPPSSAEIDRRFSPGGGGADTFLAFIEHELIPHVERTYRTRPYRILAGHSFGGLFAIHALLSRPKLFKAFIVMDPSLSWNNNATVAKAETLVSEMNDVRQIDLYVTASNTAGSVPGDIRKLVSVLEMQPRDQVRWRFEWMKDETHASIPLPGIFRALNSIFDGWHLADPLELFDRGGMAAVHRHFRDGGRRAGYSRTTPPFTVSIIVAGLMRTGRLREASEVLLDDPKTYPPPWNQLDALARAYEDLGDVAKAILYYKLSLERNPRNERAKQKLSELRAPVP